MVKALFIYKGEERVVEIPEYLFVIDNLIEIAARFVNESNEEDEITYMDSATYQSEELIKIARVEFSKKIKIYEGLNNRKGVEMVCKRYLITQGIRRFENFIGFRSDELLRIKRRVQKFVNVIDKFPLYDNGINKPTINEYFKHKPYNLEIPSILGNCTLCFMKGKNALISILSLYPELADDWIAYEKEAQKWGKFGGHTYFPDVTIEQLRNIAQNNLFKDLDLSNVDAAFNCACTT